MPSTIFFERLDPKTNQFLWDYNYGEELKELITNDNSIKVEMENNDEIAYYFFDNKWIHFFHLYEDGTFFVRLSHILDHLELYYKLIEIAKKLELYLIGDEVLLFVPDYGILYDPEDPEESIEFEILTSELEEKLREKNSSIIDSINLIIEEKKAVTLNHKETKEELEKFNANFNSPAENNDVNYTKLMVIFVIVLFLTYFFVI
ncbi:hypothetical protein [Flammeovirga sp. OC4]|uniref:hypothetical protein n=1 Tax=Flammeovirga sp. OC4 TaxID=1382345 RepID=UPI0005C4F1C9|nr:hypothetical protein [Flammeovirga sp. OC4]